MPYDYAYQGKQANVARAVARDVPISPKASIMIANFIRGQPVARAQRDLQQVIDKKTAVPFSRFGEGAGHKPGIGPGKYPIKAAKAFLNVVNSVAANAKDLGLGEELKIVSVVTHRAARAMRYGRKRGRERKATHIEIVVAEADTKREKKPTKKAPEKPKEAKKDAAKDTPKPAKKDVKATEAPAKKAPVKKPAEKPNDTKKDAAKDAPKPAAKKSADKPAEQNAEKKPKTEEKK